MGSEVNLSMITCIGENFVRLWPPIRTVNSHQPLWLKPQRNQNGSWGQGPGHIALLQSETLRMSEELGGIKAYSWQKDSSPQPYKPNKGTPASSCCSLERSCKALCPPVLPSPLTSPGLMSSKAVTCKRKLFSGKEVSALGTQLWLPGSQKTDNE